MACVWIEGFETHIGSTQMRRKYASGTGSFGSASGRVFGIAGQIQAATYVTPSFGTDNTMVIGFGFRFNAHSTAFNSGSQGLYFELGADEQFHIEQESGSGLGIRFHIYRGATLIDTTSYFDFGVWHYFELKATVRDGTDGAYEFRHNGVLDISGTGVNLADSGADGWDIFAWRYSTNGGTLMRFDDVYVNNGTGSSNNDFLGPQIVEGLLPTADGDDTEWTPSSGANWDNVNDAATSTDESGAGAYNGSDTNGQRDLYEFADLTQVTATINAVQLSVQLAMESAGTRTVKTKYKDPDTTLVDGDSHVVDSTVYDEFTQVFDENPNSAAAWDVADIDDGQFGIEVVS